MRPGDIVRFKTDKETERREVTAVSEHVPWAEVEGGWLPVDHLIFISSAPVKAPDLVEEQLKFLGL